MLSRLIFSISLLTSAFICTGCALSDTRHSSVLEDFEKAEQEKQQAEAYPRNSNSAYFFKPPVIGGGGVIKKH